MVTAIRATIMLAALVGLPAAWVYYGPLPPKAQRVVDRLVATAKRAIDWEQHAGEGQSDAPAVVEGSHIAHAELVGRPAAEAASPGGTGTLATRVEPLLAKLRELGVEEYALEPWGGARQMYRFRCEMPLDDNSQVTEQFEAVAADPQASIAQVVADVSSWRAGHAAGLMQ